MDDKSGDDNTGEVRWLWRRDESGRGLLQTDILIYLFVTNKVTYDTSLQWYLPQSQSLASFVYALTCSSNNPAYTERHTKPT